MSDRKARLAALAARAGRNEQQLTTPSSDGGDGASGIDQGAQDDASKPSLSFRNYVPKDASLDASSSARTPPQPEGGGGGGGGSGRQSTKRQKTSDLSKSKDDGSASHSSSSSLAPPKKSSALEAALAKTSRESREAAGQNVGAIGGWAHHVTTPVSTKKVNWDLKRDIRQKMDKLERRTQRAIVELLRERLEREAAEGGGDMDEDSDLD